MEFVDLIPIGRDNAINRQLLTQKAVFYGLIDKNAKCPDRLMRRLLEKTRLDFIILNLSDGNGYYRPSRDDLMDLNRYIRQEESRAKATFRNLSMAKKLYADYRAERL